MPSAIGAVRSHSPGAGFALHDEILQTLYGGDAAAAAEKNFGEVLYNRGLLSSVYTTEAIRTAQAKYGNRPLTGEEVRWGLENLDLTEERLAELGLAGFTPPVKITCEDHEGQRPCDHPAMGRFGLEHRQRLDRAHAGCRAPDESRLLRPSMRRRNNITPRDCSQEM